VVKSSAVQRSTSTGARRSSSSPSQNDRGAAREPRAPRATRLEKEALILSVAERQFARFGFEGVSLDTIAAELGMSRQNILYYYASKDELYTAVLDSVLASWLASMDTLARENDPRVAIEKYVHAKLRFSQERPSGSAVFTREIMAGAPRYGEQLALNVIPLLRADVRTFERWARQGLIARVDFTHLMFVIWSSTQAYADLSTQFAMYLGKRELSQQDFDAARALLTELVWTSLRK
jgi:TetR/AcrR family transcriptional regulator